MGIDMIRSLHIGKAELHHWGERSPSMGAHGVNDSVILELGEVLGVFGDIVICIHEDWEQAMFVDFSEADEWVLVEGGEV